MLTAQTKKVIPLVVALTLFISSNSFIVEAQSEDTILPEVIEDFARFLFIDLMNLASSSPDAFVLYAKFLFFLLVFSVLYWGASKIPNMGNRISGTITFIFALISTVLIPRDLIIFIFETYSTLISVFFAFLPFLIGLLLAHRVFPGDETHYKVLRGVIYIAMAVFTFALVGMLESFDDPLYTQLGRWAAVAAFISLIAGVAAFLGSMGIGIGKGEGDSGGGESGGSGGGSSGKNTRGEARQEVRVDEKSLKLLKNIEKDLSEKVLSEINNKGINNNNKNRLGDMLGQIKDRVNQLKGFERYKISEEKKREITRGLKNQNIIGLIRQEEYHINLLYRLIEEAESILKKGGNSMSAIGLINRAITTAKNLIEEIETEVNTLRGQR